jgi:hypothetical protein
MLLLLLLLSASPFSLVHAQSHDGNSNCQCYAVQSDTDTAYFTNHRFYDFRFFAKSSTDFRTAPANITDKTNVGVTQSALLADSFTKDWSIQDWSLKATTNSPIARYNSLQNIYITQTSYTDVDPTNVDATTYLTLRTQRQPGFQSIAEMENTQRNLMYGTFRFRARVRGDAGACAGMFIFFSDNNEADIEILTREATSTEHYTNQPSLLNGDEIPGASIEVDNLPSWTEWRTHRIDWLPGITRSYIDGKLVAINKVNVPKQASFLDLNLWSDGGVWTGAMAQGGGAEFQVQWIEASFNTSATSTKMKRGSEADDADIEINESILENNLLDKRAAQSCSTVCTIDGLKLVGQPEVLAQVSINMCPKTVYLSSTIMWLAFAYIPIFM